MKDFSGGELDRLRVILRLAHAIERDWPRDGRQSARRAPGAGLPGGAAGDATGNAPDSNRDPRLAELRARIARLGTAENGDLRRLAKWADHLHEGLSLQHFFALLVPFERLAQRSVRDDEFLALETDARPGSRTPGPLVAVLENLRSAFNVGAIFRTAECFGAAELLLCGYTPDPSDEKTAKTAMGTGGDVPWRRFERASDAVDGLRAGGYSVIAMETVADARPLGDFRFPERTALLLGNERFGLSPDVLTKADARCRIPLRGRKNSLNVGIAFGIAAAEFDRQRETRND